MKKFWPKAKQFMVAYTSSPVESDMDFSHFDKFNDAIRCFNSTHAYRVICNNADGSMMFRRRSNEEIETARWWLTSHVV